MHNKVIVGQTIAALKTSLEGVLLAGTQVVK